MGKTHHGEHDMTTTKTPTQHKPAEAARQLLKSHGALTAPIDVRHLAAKLKIDVLYEDLDDDISGFLLLKNNKPYIAINKSHHPNRQRFSLAHEIAHFVLHSNPQKSLFVDRLVYFRNVASKSGEVREEIEANTFAAELLMPEFLLRNELKNYGEELDENDIFKLANAFGVSSEAMGYRLANLNWIKTA